MANGKPWLFAIGYSKMNPSVERFTGFAQVYDQVRPSPPEAIADLLLQFAKLETAERVVDLGCGSGLSMMTGLQ
jgi:predicted TPR repeat methyltransferase